MLQISKTNNDTEVASGAENPPESVEPICQPPKRKKKEENNRMVLPSENPDEPKNVAIIRSYEPPNNNSNSADEEILFFSKFICSKMQKYEKSTKNAVQRAIMNIIFKADEGYTDFSPNYKPKSNSYNNYEGDTGCQNLYTAVCKASPRTSESAQSSPASPEAAQHLHYTDSDYSEDPSYII